MTTQVAIGTKVSGRAAWLSPAAAASWARMLAAGMPDGGITDAGRTRAEQAALYADYLAGKLLATAAKPGTSLHEQGDAVDRVTTHAGHAWMLAHGAAHGWTRPLLRAKKPEPWHWQYVPKLDQHRNAPTPAAPAPTPLEVPDIMATTAELDTLLAQRLHPLLAAVAGVQAQLDASDYAYQLDGGARGIWVEVGAHSRMWLDVTAYALHGAPRVVKLPHTSEFWARTILYAAGELFSRDGDPTGAAYVLAADAAGRVVLRHVPRPEYEAWGSPTITRLSSTHPVWTLLPLEV